MEGHTCIEEFTSHILNHTFPLHVYIPPNYSEQYPCQVAITGDGQDFFKLGKIAEKMEDLILEEGAEETIVVGVPYPRISYRRLWYVPGGEQINEYHQFLAEELLPFLQDKYSIEQGPKSCTLLGDSLAGSMGLLACLKYPHLFQRVVMMSPYVNDDLIEKVSNSHQLSFIDMYQSVGLDEVEATATDGRTLDFVEMGDRLHDVMKQHAPAQYTYKKIPGGQHIWRTWRKTWMMH
ncbi:putative acetyl esterase YjcH [Geomicrobium sp. JCM 19037]|uniref:alpha/beta hydrolase n=1 Tax=Geomicrobium sp. JCM 19037 TaxID=1460634 RepID=UPI00045F3125|nr:alpha/beta hydrolase-fold protein [Geomicrobium sp. JCM 19037]GAK04329.1 putative acetyl esterase YjcH [Geomicrobium sp. JCM 19037]